MTANFCRHRMRIKFHKHHLAVEQNNYLDKIANGYMNELNCFGGIPLEGFQSVQNLSLRFVK